MKDQKNGSTAVLSRFGRDKRVRTVTASTERVERRPRLQRDATDSVQSSFGEKPRRTSYNPHFTADNRPMFDKPHRGERSHGDEERPRRQFGEKPHGRKSAYGERKSYADNEHKSFGDRQSHGEKRSYGEKKSFDGRSGDFRKSNDRSRGGKFGDKQRTDRKYNEKSYRAGSERRQEKPSYPRYNPEKQIGEMRLNRFIAQSGICSRREADDFILAGLVTVNGKIVTELGVKVLPSDEVKFNDSRVQGEKKVYLVLNKPKGYVTSLDDPHATKTVMDLVSGACEERIYPVGRLDKNSLGLLLFTNDGDLTKQLTHPSYRKKKIYQVSLDKPLSRADMDRIAEGITLEDGEIFADEISYVKENKQEVGIEIHSGRNRIVRRIFEFLGYEVKKLDRVYYAGLTKKNLKRGAWRFLSKEEVERLKSGLYD